MPKKKPKLTPFLARFSDDDLALLRAFAEKTGDSLAQALRVLVRTGVRRKIRP